MSVITQVSRGFFIIMDLILILVMLYLLIIYIRSKKSIGEFLQTNKIKQTTEKYFKNFNDSMRDLQPVAFFISMSIILAGIFEKGSISRVYALLAVLLFMAAYAGFYLYNLSKNILWFYWGLFVILIGINSILNSLGGITSIFSNINDETISSSLGLIVICSLILINIQFLSEIPKKTTYKVIFFFTTISFIVILFGALLSFFDIFIENEFIKDIILILTVILVLTIALTPFLYHTITDLISSLKLFKIYLYSKLLKR